MQIFLLELRTDKTILRLSLLKAQIIQAIERLGFCSSIFTHLYHFITNNCSLRCSAKSTEILTYILYTASSVQRSVPQAGPGYWRTNWSPVPGFCWSRSCLVRIGLRESYSPPKSSQVNINLFHLTLLILINNCLVCFT